jgi:hypothetical protein
LISKQGNKPVLQPVKVEALVDNFRTNIIEDPSDSDWDTTPATSAIKFFGGMADHERRRGLFGDDNEDEKEQRREVLEQEKDQTEVTFGFPILDLTRETYP